MSSDGFEFCSAAVLGGHPLYRLLVTSPVAFFSGALLSNLVFYAGADLVGRASAASVFTEFMAAIVNIRGD
jgi:uncharacterized membrane protein